LLRIGLKFEVKIPFIVEKYAIFTYFFEKSFIKERENNKVSQFLKTRKERKQKFFAKKIFVFSLRSPARGQGC
jgi:hypothetical protein